MTIDFWLSGNLALLVELLTFGSRFLPMSVRADLKVLERATFNFYFIKLHVMFISCNNSVYSEPGGASVNMGIF